MTSRIYSAFDPAALGQGLDLSQTNTILAVAETTDVNRCARALYGKSSGTWNAEFMIWGDGTLAGYASVGLVDAQASMAKYVGGDAHGWGYRWGDGKMRNNDADLATVAVGKAGDVVGLSLTFDSSGNGTAIWTLGTATLYTQALPPGTYFLAATVAGVQASALQCFLNCGQRGFEYGDGAGGWYIVQPLLDSIYIASAEYITAPTDDPSSTPFDSTIVDGQSFAVLRQLNFMMQGGTSVVPAVATLEIANPGGQYDPMIPGQIENRPIVLQELDSEDAAYSTAAPVGNFIVTKVAAADENKLQLTVKDAIALLDAPLQNHLILPNAEANAVNQPWQFLLGAARNVSLILIDAKKNTYAVSDVPVVGFGYVRDMGDPFDPNASPPDYTIGAGRTTITTGSQAQGIVTGDFSSIGGGTLPTSATDIFGSAGNPFTGTAGSVPTGWTYLSGWGTGAPVIRTGGGGIVQFQPGLNSLKLSASNTMLAGRSYRLTITIEPADWNHPYSDTTQPSDTLKQIALVRGKTAGLTDALWMIPVIPGTYSTVITNTGASFTPIFAVRDGGTFTTPYVNISKLSLLEIADTYVPSNILPITLADFVDAIMAKLRKIGVAIPYSRADLEAIDEETGFAGIGYAAIGQVTARQALDMALASYCACAWMDSTGTLRFTRLAIPEEKTADIIIDSSDFLSDISPGVDPLPGLTTQVGYRYNWTVLKDSDFVTDFIDVPSSVRRAMSRQCQGIASTAAPLAPAYAQAVFQNPFWSLLDRREDAQALADYFGRIGAKLRRPYTVDLPAGIAQLGKIAFVPYKRFGLSGGRNLQIQRISERKLDEIETVTFWG
jgi:hypothetical protein